MRSQARGTKKAAAPSLVTAAGQAMAAAWALVSSAALALSAAPAAAVEVPGRDAPDAAFALSADASNWTDYFPGLLANGYVSTLTAPRGTEGTPGYLVGFMDYAQGDISRPAAIPGWLQIDYSTGRTPTGQSWLNKAPLSASRFADYRQTLDLARATLTTHYRYTEGTRRTVIEVRSFVSEAAPHLAATELVLTPEFDGVIELSFAQDLWAPHAPRFALGRLTGAQMEEEVAANGLALTATPPATPDRAAIWYAGTTNVDSADADVRDRILMIRGHAEGGPSMTESAAIELPEGISPEDIRAYQSRFRLALNLSMPVQKGKSYRFAKFVAFAHEAWGDPVDVRELARAAREGGFERLLEAHETAWKALWRSDIRIDGDAAAQLLVHSDLYYLLANSTADTSWPMGACAMTPGYTGHAFWDSDSWIFPALLLLHPERAKSLVSFRGATLPAAEVRAKAHDLEGGMYPWEADPSNGTEQTPHFAGILGDREIHVDADVAIAQWQYYLATGDRDWLRRSGWPVLRAVARFWTSRVHYDAKRRRYEILHVTSVREEYSDVSNDMFTNASAAKALRIAADAADVIGERPDPRWRQIAEHLYLPFDTAGQHHLDFDPPTPAEQETDPGSTLTLLNLPSLDAPMSARVRANDHRYAMEDARDASAPGNSMGFAPNSIAAAAVGETAAAIAWFRGNFTSGMIKPPFNVRTETPGNNTGYFLTASGGFIQNLVFGFTGLRLEADGLDAAYAPVLPRDWTSLTLVNVALRGMHYDIRVARDAGGTVVLTRTLR